MEELCNQITEALESDINAYELLTELEPEIRELEEYYEGMAWREDYDAERNGVFPRDLKRGILSEDTLYDLLGDVYRVLEELNN